jgi:hypothetical protein
VRSAIGGTAALQARITVSPSPAERVQEVLQGQIASVMFYAGGEVSELGRSPTRMGEILGCGLPVVANEGVGDVARILREHRVGVLAAGADPASMARAWDELQDLLRDPGLAARCRTAAQQLFSLQAGTESYGILYRAILDRAAVSSTAQG